MTDSEKKARLAVLISPDTASDDLLTHLIGQAEGFVLARRYPFGVPEGANVPAMYETIQLQIAVELFSKMGAEGQLSHNENGVYRSYESGEVSSSLMKRITPLCGSVM